MFDSFMNVPFMFDPWKKHKRNKSAQWKNNRVFYNWFIYLSELYMNMIEFKNLPPDISTRYVMEVLFLDGKIFGFSDKTKGIMMMKGSGIGVQNEYWEFMRYRMAGNRYFEEYDAEDCALIRENQWCYPPVFMVETLAEEIADASRSINVYARTMKRPFLVDGDVNKKLTLSIVADEIDENELLVLQRGGIAMEGFNPVPNRMDANGLAALWRHKHELIAEFSTFTGLNNANSEKRERLITAEAEANDELIAAGFNKSLDWIKIGIADMNKKFGTNIEAVEKHPKEVEEDGEVDDRNEKPNKNNANI